ncbi:MAG: SWIM zinc finger family protein, partial [Candidatus Obscuribacterales bacterium]|nr:SWIM zinc finger family protein [Steroidobacteraceae bacterium]
NIDEAFRAAGHSVFLGKQRELEADCTCADWASPCKHVAAVHYVLGEAFDKDPFLLFELRGRNRAQVLGALRAARASDAGRGNAADATMLEKITATANGRSPRIVDSPSKSNTVALSEPLTGFTPADFERAPVLPSTLGFRIEAPAVSGALLRQLGPPPSWNEEDLPFETLMDLYRLASRKALALALPDSPPASSANGESQATKKIRRRANKSVS